jgi:hypothetical protein
LLVPGLRWTPGQLLFQLIGLPLRFIGFGSLL